MGVSDGRTRVDVPYVWPSTLHRDQSVVHLYLDLNHWIQLAKASVGHRHGRPHRGLLGRLTESTRAGAVIVPLSATHYMEMSLITDPGQRRDIAETMESISSFRTLLDQWLILRLEVEAMLDTRVGRRPEAYADLDLVGQGFGHAIGINGQLEIHSRTKSRDELRATWPGGPVAFDAELDRLQHISEQRMLRGPADDELPDLAKHGYNLDAFRQVARRRAQQEQEQADRFDADPQWRRGRIRDTIAARHLSLEIIDLVTEGVFARDKTLTDAIDGRDAVRSFVDAMPTSDVRVSLLVARHRNPQTKWSANDIYDLDALGTATAYCDIVATERHAARLLSVEGIASRLNTTVATSAEDVLRALEVSLASQAHSTHG